MTPQSLASDQISKNLTFLWASFASRPTDRFFIIIFYFIINTAIIFFIKIMLISLVRPPSVFPIDGLTLQSNLIGATTKQEWSKVLYQYQPHQDHDHLVHHDHHEHHVRNQVSERGSIATYNISLHRGGIFHDFRKAVVANFHLNSPSSLLKISHDPFLHFTFHLRKCQIAKSHKYCDIMLHHCRSLSFGLTRWHSWRSCPSRRPVSKVGLAC